MNIDIKELPILETERLIIRPINLDDAEDMFEYATRDDVGPNAGWQPHKEISASKKTIESMISNFLTEFNIGVFSIVYKENKKMIGTIGVHRFNKRYGSCEIGYVLNPLYWGKGIIVECAQRVIKWLFDDLNLYRIECGHFDFNYQSKRVIEKLDFKFEGISRKKILLPSEERCDLFNYSILKDEYLNKYNR